MLWFAVKQWWMLRLNGLLEEWCAVTSGLLVAASCFTWQEPRHLLHFNVISYILLPVQRVACESGASVLGLVGTAMFPAAQGEVHGTQLQPCVMHESPSETQTGPFGVGGRK